jgi:hypothetical protein
MEGFVVLLYQVRFRLGVTLTKSSKRDCLQEIGIYLNISFTDTYKVKNDQERGRRVCAVHSKIFASEWTAAFAGAYIWAFKTVLCILVLHSNSKQFNRLWERKAGAQQ